MVSEPNAGNARARCTFGVIVVVVAAVVRLTGIDIIVVRFVIVIVVVRIATTRIGSIGVGVGVAGEQRRASRATVRRGHARAFSFRCRLRFVVSFVF